MHKVFKFTAKVNASSFADIVKTAGDGFVTLAMCNGIVRVTAADGRASAVVGATRMPGSGDEWLCLATSGKALARSVKCAGAEEGGLIELVIFDGGEGMGFQIRKEVAGD